MSAIERLYKYLNYKGIKATNFEKDIALSKGYLSNQKAKKGGIGEKNINTIINNCSDMNPEWFITGNGKMLKEDANDNNVKPYAIPEDVDFEHLGATKESINERIKHIKTIMNFNYSSFARKIGLNQSAVKNVTGGRNNPSYDFIAKVLAAFPYISSEWLMRGKGHMLKNRVKEVGEYLIAQEAPAVYKVKKEKEKDVEFKQNDCSELKESYKTVIDTQKLLIESLQDQIKLYKK